MKIVGLNRKRYTAWSGKNTLKGVAIFLAFSGRLDIWPEITKLTLRKWLHFARETLLAKHLLAPGFGGFLF
jgi:hypothetical protein